MLRRVLCTSRRQTHVLDVLLKVRMKINGLRGVQDTRLPSRAYLGRPHAHAQVWHLNLLGFEKPDGKATYNKYAKALGT